MDHDDETTPAESPTGPEFYANVMSGHVSPFDFTILFGRKTPEQDKAGEGHFDEQCRVVMSLSHAKSMLPILAKLIANYETQFGKIPSPGYDESAKD